MIRQPALASWPDVMAYEIKFVSPYVYRSSRPTFEQLTAWAKDLGIGAAANLEGDQSDIVHNEKMDCSKIGIDESYFRMDGLWRPKPMMLIEYASFIKCNIIAKIKTLTHCKFGVDRTGIAIATHNVVNEGWDVEKAWQDCLDNGMHELYFWWKESLEEAVLIAKG